MSSQCAAPCRSFHIRHKGRDVAVRGALERGKYVTCAGVEPGVVRVCMGPMFSGKSSWLGQHATRARHGPARASLLVMPTANDRDLAAGITTHDRVVVPMDTLRVPDLAAALQEAEPRLMLAEEVFVEEGQFLGGDLDWAAEQLALLGKNVYVTLLTTTFQRAVWDGTRAILAVADEVEMLSSVCQCGRAANFTSKLHGDRSGARIVETGGADKYAAHCRVCYLRHAGALPAAGDA